MAPPKRIMGANICFDCERACGGCSWTEVDPETGKLRWEPVPGWTAEPTTLQVGSQQTGIRHLETYHITACPLFVRTPPRKSKPLPNTTRKGDPRYCEHCGKPLIGRNPSARYCSTQCHDAERRARKKAAQMNAATRKATALDIPVIRTDPVTGEEVRFPAMTLAAASVDGSRSRVSQSCATGRLYHNYYWRKEKEDTDANQGS